MKRRLATVRVRTTVAATAVVGLAMIVGALLLVALLRGSLLQGVENSVELRAMDIAAEIESNPGTSRLSIDDRDDMLVQVIDAGGTVVASSHNVQGRAPVARPVPGESTIISVPIDDTDFLAMAESADTPGGPCPSSWPAPSTPWRTRPTPSPVCSCSASR